MAITGPTGVDTAAPVGPASPSNPNPQSPGVTDTPGSGTGTGGPTIGGLTTGWWMFIGISVGIALGGTRAAPVVFGVLTLALIYQTTLLLEHK